METLPLQSRVILVTGAGTGLGRTSAQAFAAQGATVLLLGRTEERLNEVYDLIVEAGHPTPAVFPFDLSAADEAGFEGLANTIAQQLGRLDGILHSASRFMPLGPLSGQHLAQWLPVFATNVFAPFALTRSCLPLLHAAPDASVLFTAEEHGLHPTALWGGFGISQAALVKLAQVFAAECTEERLRFNIIVPGAVASPMRVRTHPGEVNRSQRDPQSLMETYCYWMGRASRGRNGEVVRP
jgi:NAD(P)-dependent dehydrogenase (short-subunit alcohol dehydrogenase family)